MPVPEAYAGASSPEAPPADWFHFFASRELAGLVDEAQEANFDLLAAWQRVEEARALAAQAAAARWPQVTAEGGATRERAPVPAALRASGPEAYRQTSYRASLGAAYEVDLWGRLDAREEAAELREQARLADYRALGMTIAAEVTAAWLDLIELRLRAELLGEQAELARELLELAVTRLGQGQGSALDVTQQEQRVKAVEAALEQQETASRLTRNRLAVLVGDAPQSFAYEPPGALPEMGPSPGLGRPADLLQRRPDLEAAFRQLQAADAETAAAVASRLPQLRLEASLFLQATDPAALLDTLFWSVGAGLSGTLFSGGREEARVDAAEARARGALFRYADRFATALREVADARDREAGQRRYLERVEAQLEAADEALSLATERYQRGAVDYQRVLLALDSLNQLQREALQARRDLLGFRVQLHRALGGGVEVPIPSSESQKMR